MDGGRRHLEMALEIGFGGCTAKHLGAGVNEGQILPLLFRERRRWRHQARVLPLTLEGIKQRVRERHPEAPDFSIDRLAARLKKRRFSYKRCRLSLKKIVLNKNL